VGAMASYFNKIATKTVAHVSCLTLLDFTRGVLQHFAISH
jgi:hypothetical protein